MTATTGVVVFLVLGVWVQPSASRPLAYGTCMKLGPQVVGSPPVKAGGGVAPKKRVHIAPKYPALPSGTRVGVEPWVGEVLIDEAGKVARVWQLRGFRVVPEFVAVDQAVIDAIQQWQFEPLVTNGRATPVCLAVTTSINLQ